MTEEVTAPPNKMKKLIAVSSGLKSKISARRFARQVSSVEIRKLVIP